MALRSLVVVYPQPSHRMNTFELADRPINLAHPPLVVAEIGINHGVAWRPRVWCVPLPWLGAKS